MNRWLVDTGPLVAYLDRDDPDHEFVAGKLDSLTGESCTTSAVITEAMHLMGDDARGPGMLLGFLVSARVKVYECMALPELGQAVRLMAKYHDLPMDFADATLVVLAGKIKLSDICTLDRRGFRTYRTPAGNRFRLLLDEPG